MSIRVLADSIFRFPKLRNFEIHFKRKIQKIVAKICGKKKNTYFCNTLSNKLY